MNLADMVNDTHRSLVGLSPSDEIRIAVKARNLSTSDAEAIRTLVDESCKKMSDRLDYLVSKAVSEIREGLEKK